MELEFICRVCLKEGRNGKKLKSIFSLKKREGGQIVRCPDMLIQCASVTICKDDGYPSHICHHCYRNLLSAYKFRHLCEMSFEYLKDCVREGKSSIELKIETLNDEIENQQCLDVALFRDVKSLEIKVEKENHNDNYVSDNPATEVEDADSHNDNYAGEFQENADDTIETQPQKQRHKLIKLKRAKDIVKKNNNKTWKCSHCAKTFKTQKRLLSHEDAHVGIKRYFCDICQKAYRSEKEHKNQHRYSRKYKCDVCSKGFNARSRLASHVVIHDANRKRLICGLNGCIKEFLSEVGLQRHKNFHDGIRSAMCHLCSKTFLDKYALKLHLKSHNNEKNYKCSYCDKRFITTSNKTLHEKIHTNIRNHKCTYCEQSFYSTSKLKRHLTTHTKILKEECRFCDKKFARRDNRRRHEAVMHGLSEDKQDRGNADVLKNNEPEQI